MGKKTEWKDGKEVETEEPNIINDTNPLWMRQPSTLKDEDYTKFYRDLYPMMDEPLFWIHLNVDYPFHLTGVLYFPRLKSNVDIRQNKIQLYCNQVYVTDEVENIVPEFLTLLHGVIDSPDIPLNVSRSYLQSDANVKKISGYIMKKVSDRLQSIFKEDRKTFEEKWDDLKLFINYGMLSEQDFFDRAKTYALLKDVGGKYYTFEEYKQLIAAEQTDKDGNLVYLYANSKEEQYAYIQAAEAKGYSVLLLDGQLDTPLVQMLEQKFEKSRFVRVDSDAADRLIPKAEATQSSLTQVESDNLSETFKAGLPKLSGAEFTVEVASMGEKAAPVLITQSEYMRRMKDVARLQPGMGFYGQMPDMYSVILNADHRLIKTVLADMTAAVSERLQPVDNEMNGLNARRAALEQQQKDKKPDEITQEQRDELTKCNADIERQRSIRREILGEYAKSDSVIAQLIDLALLQNGLLKGEALSNFLQRSVDMIKK